MDRQVPTLESFFSQLMVFTLSFAYSFQKAILSSAVDLKKKPDHHNKNRDQQKKDSSLDIKRMNVFGRIEAHAFQIDVFQNV